jgi:hypothetical protein
MPTVLRALLIAIVAVLVSASQQQARTVVAFGHLWDGTKMLDDVVVTVERAISTPRSPPPSGHTVEAEVPDAVELHA